MIIVQSPLRISLFGGGTDLPDFYLQKGGCVLSSTIDKYIFITAKKRFDRLLRVGYTKTELVESIDELQHELIREAFIKTGIQEGIEVTTMGDIPSQGSGLGSSSTVTVGTLHALYTYLGENVPAERLAREACEIEIDVLGKPAGVQDQYIAAFGGIRFLEFQPDGEIIVNKLLLGRNERRRLEDSLMLFYTGTNRKSESILTEQKTNIQDRMDILLEMKHLAYMAKENLETGNFDELGAMMHYSWNLKKRLASNISNQEIDEVYMRARKAGALGGKITGAGGGGFLLIYTPQEFQDSVRSALADLQEVPFNLEPDGVKVIFNYRRGPDNGIDEAQTATVPMNLKRATSKETSNLQTPIKMDHSEQANGYKQYVSDVAKTLSNLPYKEIAEVEAVLRDARSARRKIFIFGNGGSAATASHFVCDLGKNTHVEGLLDFQAIGLNDNVPVLSALANDTGFENIFVQPLSTLLQPEDVVIAISTSGNSRNVLKAVQYAKDVGSTTIGFTGFDGGALSNLIDIEIRVPGNSIEQIEDFHLLIEHMITKSLREVRSQDETRLLAQSSEFQTPPQLERISSASLEHLEDEFKPIELLRDQNSLEMIYSISRILAASGPSGGQLEDILLYILERFGAASGSLYVLDEAGRQVVGLIAFNGDLKRIPADEIVDVLDRGLAGWVHRNNVPAIVSNTESDPRWLNRNMIEHQRSPRSAICVPMSLDTDHIGVLTLVQSNADMFQIQDLAILYAIAICISSFKYRI